MYYQITEKNLDYHKGCVETPTIFIGNEQAVFDFVNERSSDAYDEIDSMEVAKQWLEENGYKYEIKKDLVDRLEKGEIVYIQ